MLAENNSSRNDDLLHQSETFVCSECKDAKFRSKELLNEHVFEEHGKQ
jgi:hypothetical protein